MPACRAHDRRFPQLCLAPEGTCSDGRHILRFRKRCVGHEATPMDSPAAILESPLENRLHSGSTSVLARALVFLSGPSYVSLASCFDRTRHGHAGAFVPGAPVLPVVLQYRWRHLNPAWTIIDLGWHAVRSQKVPPQSGQSPGAPHDTT